MFKHLVFSFFIATLNSLNFDLNESHTKQCFFLRGQNIGHELKLDYQLMGNYENLRFTILDLNDNDMILKVKEHTSTSNSINQKVNYLHNFMLCWQSRDSESKAVNFNFIQEGLVSYLDKDDVDSHRRLIKTYQNHIKQILENIKLQYVMEEYYTKVLNEQEFKVKISYLIRGLILITIIWAQTQVFLAVIDRKLKDVKDIVLGN